MKRISIFLALLCALFAVSCKKDAGTNTKPSSVYNILNIHVNEAYQKVSIAVNAAKPMKIPVEVSAVSIGGVPPAVSMLNDVVASVEPQGIIECTIEEDGVSIEPKAVGNATLTLSPKTLLGEPVSCEVTVTEKPAEPASVEIITTDSHFTGKTLKLLEGDSFNLQAVVKNDKGDVTLVPITWSLDKGSNYVTLDADGHLTTKTLSGTAGSAIVSVSVDGYSAIKDQIDVEVQLVPKSISLSMAPYTDNSIITKKGKKRSFTVSVQPADADQNFEVILGAGNQVTSSVSGNQVTLNAVNSSAKEISVTIRSKSRPDVSTYFYVYVFDYDEFDTKPGDYVYYNSSVKCFVSSDCGLRYVSGSTRIYQGSDGKSSAPKDYLGETSVFGNFIGVVVKTSFDTNNLFECDQLENCKNSSNSEVIAELYKFRNLRLNSLSGFYNNTDTHALVLKKNQTEEIEWQHNNECIAATDATKSGLYQYQLSRYMPLSKQELDNGWKYETYSQTYYKPYESKTYFQSGLVPSMLLKFYSNHLNDSDYEVLPVLRINDDYNDVPKLTDEKGTTGWFLPGEFEWGAIKENLQIVKASLSKCGATSLSGYYWSTEEEGLNNVGAYNVGTSVVSRSSRYKDARKHTTEGTAHTRAVLYL